MKAGDRVQLMEPLCELVAGITGTAVVYNEKFPFTPPGVETTKVLSVLFDGEKYPCTGRTINGVYVSVISKCKVITG